MVIIVPVKYQISLGFGLVIGSTIHSNCTSLPFSENTFSLELPPRIRGLSNFKRYIHDEVT